MVVTGIFMVLSVVVLSANSRFGNHIVLQNLAHDMALAIREAQVYGISVKRFQGSNFDIAYGMHFMLPGAGESSTYELFADSISNGVFDPGETQRSSTLAGGYVISDVCAREALSGIETCSLPEINILFQRPEPDAIIRRSASSPFDDRARIVVSSPKGTSIQVIVEASGQISVQ